MPWGLGTPPPNHVLAPRPEGSPELLPPGTHQSAARLTSDTARLLCDVLLQMI